MLLFLIRIVFPHSTGFLVRISVNVGRGFTLLKSTALFSRLPSPLPSVQHGCDWGDTIWPENSKEYSLLSNVPKKSPKTWCPILRFKNQNWDVWKSSQYKMCPRAEWEHKFRSTQDNHVHWLFQANFLGQKYCISVWITCCMIKCALILKLVRKKKSHIYRCSKSDIQSCQTVWLKHTSKKWSNKISKSDICSLATMFVWCYQSGIFSVVAQELHKT